MLSIKEQKEASVTGHEGSDPWEILLIVSTTPIGLLFYQVVTTSIAISDWRRLLLWETLSFFIPMILCQSNRIYPVGVGYLVIQLAVAAFARLRAPRIASPTKSDSRDEDAPERCRRAIIDTYRASLMYLTFIAILAVDFRVFPRRFVKTETRGYSLMDVGAGSFVLAAGLVSPRSRGRIYCWRRTVLRMVPLLVLGSIRLLTHKGLDYQEHVSEYGVHWNFFFTMAILSPVAFLVPGPSLLLPIMILMVYQAILSSGLQSWIVTAPRTCDVPQPLCYFLAANREGLLGCIGYGALYLISEWIGYHFIGRNRHVRDFTFLSVGLGVALFAITELLGFQVSRRSTNGPFILWILFVNMMQFTAIAWVMDQSFRIPLLFKALNRNGLAMFVIANLLTGLTNLSLNTLIVPDLAALIILFIYVQVLGGIAYALSIFRRDSQAEAEKRKQS